MREEDRGVLRRTTGSLKETVGEAVCKQQLVIDAVTLPKNRWSRTLLSLTKTFVLFS